MWQETPYTLVLLAGAGLSAVSAFFTWRYVYAPGARWAALLLLASTEWMLGYALEMGSVDLVAKVFWNKIEYLGIATIPTAFLIFTLKYTGRERWLTRRNLALLSIEPVIVFLLALTNESHHLIWVQNILDTTNSFSALVNVYGLGFWVHTAYSYILLLTVTLLLVQMLLRSRNMYAWQASTLLLASFLPWFGNGLYISRLSPFPMLDLTPLFFTVAGVAVAWGISGLRLGDIASVSRRAAIESMSDGVLVLDAENRIVDLNPVAQELFGGPKPKLIGQRIERVWPEWSDRRDPLGDEAAPARWEMVSCRGDVRRTYDVCVSPLTDWQGHLISNVFVIRDITERKLLEQELARRYEDAMHLADRDSVTGILNHRAIHERLDRELKRARRGGHQLSIVMMDLDDFKLFNDTYGHPIGDKILKDVARFLVENGRETDIVGRYGGDEFVAVLPETGTEGAVEFAERLRSTLLEHPYVADGSFVPIRSSFGIATYPENGRQIQELVDFADANLYESKQHGGNTITAGEATERDELTNFGAFGVLDALVTAVDHKDHYTRKHSEDATDYALMIAQAMGFSEEAKRTLRMAGLLHDVGKIGVPDRILRKPGRLDDEEFAVVKQHAILGEMIIQEIPNLPDVMGAIGTHHERVDGKGYPRGLKGDEIPLLGRILAVVDAYSAMTTDRPYRKAMSHAEARAELLRVAGTQLDPELVRVFLSVMDERTEAAASI